MSESMLFGKNGLQSDGSDLLSSNKASKNASPIYDDSLYRSMRNTVLVSLLLFLMAFFPRMILYSSLKLNGKIDHYWELALTLQDEKPFVLNFPQSEFDNSKPFFFTGVPTTHRLPATPILLAILSSISGESDLFVKMFHAIFTSFVSVLIYLSLKNLGKPNSGVFAGILWAFWPYSLFLGHEISFMTEPLALYCMSIFMYVSTLKNINLKTALLTGIVLGVSVANRAESYMFAIAYLVLLGFLKTSWRKYLILIATITILIQLPWLYRNYRLLGRPVMSSLTGFSLWIGNNPWTEGSFDYNYSLDDPQIKYVSDRFPDLWQVDAATRSDYFKRVTWDYLMEILKNDPKRVISLYGKKALFFLVLPSSQESRTGKRLNWKGRLIEYGTPIHLTIFKLTFIFFLLQKRPNADEIFFILPMAFVFAISILVFPMIRYEYSCDIGMILFIASRFTPRLPQKFSLEPSINDFQAT